jgi:hypothetical protein
MVKIEETVLGNLLLSEKFSRVVIPFLKPEYFQDRSESTILKIVIDFFTAHNHPITKEILNLELKEVKGLSDSDLESSFKIVSNLSDAETSLDWLLPATEEFCRKRSVYLGIMEAIQILDGKSDLTEDAIPKLLSDAISVNFDASVGHDYLSDAGDRFDQYTLKEDKIAYGIVSLDDLTQGGMSRKTLNSVGAQSGGGKSIFMTSTAANVLKSGKNVLFITMEMSEIKISERIDANLMNVKLDSIKDMTKDSFMTKIEKISEKTRGKLFVKEYPTGAAHSGHFRGLLEELKTKQNFIPDLVIIDYLGICASARLKMGGSVNTNSYVKTIAEELRALAIEYDVPVLTGHQLNRGGFCLDLSTEIITSTGKRQIKDIFIGDLIYSNTGWNTVKRIYPVATKDRYKITTASGKSIICSAEHMFPVDADMLEKSVTSGLNVGDLLHVL